MPPAALREQASDSYGKTTAVKVALNPLSSASDSVFTKPIGTPVESIYVSTTSNTTMLSANAGRKGLFIKNLAGNAITIRLDGSVAVSGAGLVLAATGTVGDTISSDMLGFVPTGAITTINATGNSNVYIVVLN